MVRKRSSVGTGKQRVTPQSLLQGFRGTLGFVFVLSGVVNILALTGSFYMLQIYDRALTSRSVPTLLALSLIVLGLFAIQGILDVLRSQILVRLGAKLDVTLAPLAHKVAIDMPRFGYSTTAAMERGRDVDTLRQFFGGQGPVALFDLPWLPIYFLFVYLLHPWLGVLVLVGAVVLTALTLLTEVLSRGAADATMQSAIKRQSLIDMHARNSEVIRALGFSGRAVARFQAANVEHLAHQTRLNDVAGSLSGIAKVLRTILQSALLGFGAYLAIKGELSPGAIIAASIAGGRALAPVDLVISQWKNIVAARKSYIRLGDTLTSLDKEVQPIQLPAPKSTLSVEKVTIATPSDGAIVLSDVSFELKAGQALGLIGTTGSGKSTLARGLTGVWPLVRGAIRLDGAEINQWSGDDIGKHIGYLPQDVALFDGTVAENIARFDPEMDSTLILEAARAAGVDQMILRLPNGYQTQLGPHGTALSAGQRQRIALARALYRQPFLVILDEPNSNLDAEGDAALTGAVRGVCARGGIAIVIAHRPSALQAVDLVGVLQGGKLVALGPGEAVLQWNNEKAKSSPQVATAAGAARSPKG